MTLSTVTMSEGPGGDEARSFLTYLNYVAALARFMKGETETLRSGALRAVVNSEAYSRIQGGRCQQLDRARLLLRNAWLTEIQLGLPARFEDFAPYANQWGVVQLYYSVYLAVRALFLASNQDVREEHAATLRTVTSIITQRPELFPFPIRTTAIGDPKVGCTWTPLPQGVTISRVSPLKRGDSVPFWDSYGMFLKTTRQRRIELRVDEWKKKNGRKRIPASERASIVDALPATSFFDCLQRLRVRSNYADAESFLASLANEGEALQFHRSLCSVCWHTLLSLELLLTRYLGKTCIATWVDEFSALDRGQLGAELGRRWMVLKEIA